VQIVEEWSFTDVQQNIWMAVRYRNNGPNPVVFFGRGACIRTLISSLALVELWRWTNSLGY